MGLAVSLAAMVVMLVLAPVAELIYQKPGVGGLIAVLAAGSAVSRLADSSEGSAQFECDFGR